MGWSNVSTLPYEFYRGAAVVLNNEIHILGTDYDNSTFKAHYKYSNGEFQEYRLYCRDIRVDGSRWIC